MQIPSCSLKSSNMSSTRTHSSDSYMSMSTASSSSLETISTMDSGDLFVITFMTGGNFASQSQLSSSRNDSPEQENRTEHHPHSDHSPHVSHSSSPSPDNDNSSCHCSSSSSSRINFPKNGQSKFRSHSPESFAEDTRSSSTLTHRHVLSVMRHGHVCSSHSSQSPLVKLTSKSRNGLLLRCLERGVPFPLTHWSMKSSNNLMLHEDDAYMNEGIYQEVKCVTPPDVWLQTPSASDTDFDNGRLSTWLFIGYKSIHKTLDASIISNWKEWTGARHVYLNLRQDFEIRRICFLRRIHPQDDLDLFSYIVLMDMGQVEERNLTWLLDFVQRTRAQCIKGSFTVYTECRDPSLPLSSEIGHDEVLSSQYSSLDSSLNGSSTTEEDLSKNTLPSLASLKFIEKIIEEIQSPLDEYPEFMTL